VDNTRSVVPKRQRKLDVDEALIALSIWAMNAE
jgi:hypothetical protein